MEYQKIANLLDIASNQQSKFRTQNWDDLNDESRGTFSVNRQINFKTSMLKSSFVITVTHCDYLLKEIHQLIILWLQMLMLIILVKK